MGKRPERQIALLAKLDIAFGYGPKGRGFESLTARHVGASSAYNTPSKGWGICLLRCSSSFMHKVTLHLRCSIVNALTTLRLATNFLRVIVKKSILSMISTSRWIPRFITRSGNRAGFQIASSPFLLHKKSPLLRLLAVKRPRDSFLRLAGGDVHFCRLASVGGTPAAMYPTLTDGI